MASGNVGAARGTLARSRRDNLCPICGDYPVDCDAAVKIIRLIHNRQLEDMDIIQQHSEGNIASEPTYWGSGFLMSGSKALVANISIALNRLLKGINEHAFSDGEDDPLVIVVCRASEGKQAMEDALGKVRRGE